MPFNTVTGWYADKTKAGYKPESKVPAIKMIENRNQYQADMRNNQPAASCPAKALNDGVSANAKMYASKKEIILISRLSVMN